MRPRTIPLALAALLVTRAAAAAPAPDLKVPSRIDTVTVYRSSARVQRVARVELPAGPARIVLEGLPDQLDDDSLRVAGEGAAKARLFGVTVEQVIGEVAAAEFVRAAEEKLERLADEDRALDDRIAAARARAQFALSLRSSYSEERAKNLAVRGVAVKEWSDLAGWVEDELAHATADQRKAELEKRALARRVAQAQAEIGKLQAKRGTTSKTVAIEVEADKPGGFEVALTYVVHAAGWRPVWDARLVPDEGKMELAFTGSVWQSSGEDWTDVKLAVSTAQPARGLYVPQLEPVYLTRLQPPPPPRPYPQRAGAMRSAAPEMPSAAPAASMEVEESKSVAMDVVQASVDAGLLAATFTAPRRATVDGSGQQRKIPLARFPLQATLVRTAAPRAEAAAFLTAKAVNETGFPLLAGEAGVYVNDDFAGRVALPFTPAGGELELAFGQDERIEVDRRVVERKRETEGIVSKDEVYRYRVRVTVKNRYASPVPVKLLDLVPVSRDEKIAVKVLEGTTAATREDPDRPGVRTWELSLGSKEERVIELRYEVRYPKGFPLAGLE
jgi:uncharacterized protein (TIGR02231 family)